MKTLNNRVIITLFILVGLATAFRLGEFYGKPKCDDIVRDKYNGELVCEYGLGHTQEDSINVTMKGESLW